MTSEGWRVIDEYLHLGSSTEHCLQSLHEVLHLGWEGCVLGEGEGRRKDGIEEGGEKKEKGERGGGEGKQSAFDVTQFVTSFTIALRE